MAARTLLLLKIALVLLLLMGARELSVLSDVPVSSTGASEKDSRPLRPDVSMTTAPGPDDDDHNAVDLYGNEVTPAVATYKLDGTGALYELHSPQTELPQLAPPKS